MLGILGRLAGKDMLLFKEKSMFMFSLRVEKKC